MRDIRNKAKTRTKPLGNANVCLYLSTPSVKKLNPRFEHVCSGSNPELGIF